MKTSAKVILDSCHPEVSEARITTVQYTAPRYLLSEINTHGVLAKSAASSRAIPVRKRIEMVAEDPFIPSVFGKNKPGMQSTEELTGVDDDFARQQWRLAARYAAAFADDLAHLGVHKQQANRLLEPFVYVTGLLTGTEWDNFFKLRNHADADPEFQKLAAAIKTAMENSCPVAREEHLPFYDGPEDESAWMISGARCARISYDTFDGKVSTPKADVELCATLTQSGHMSPFDHLAGIDGLRDKLSSRSWVLPEHHGRFWGWISRRLVIERSLGLVSPRRSSFKPF